MAIGFGRDGGRVGAPLLLQGRFVEVPGRGRMFVREGGPRRGPVLMLLHGLGATADLNWFNAYPMLTKRYRVIAPDLRGHGRTCIGSRRFTLTDCAEDVAGLARALGVDRFVAVGYSMGGVVAQLLWRHHRDAVEGLVLCSTSRNFRGDPRERALFAVYPAAALFVRVAAPELARGMGKLLGAPGARTQWREWIRTEIARSSPRSIMQAASELAGFSSHAWAPSIDVPAAVVVTTSDRMIPPRRQRRLAEAIPGATMFEAHGDHFACTESPERFLTALDAACRSVLSRITRDNGDARRPAA